MKVKNEMIEKTVESFIRQLEKDGHSKYATELRSIIAMSRKKKDAEASLSAMTIPLLVHLIKVITMPQARDNKKWRGEIKSFLNRFNIRNISPRNRPWLSVKSIKEDLNDVLSSPRFLATLKLELEGYSKLAYILSFVEGHKSLEALEVELNYDLNTDLKLTLKGQEL